MEWKVWTKWRMETGGNIVITRTKEVSFGRLGTFVCSGGQFVEINQEYCRSVD